MIEQQDREYERLRLQLLVSLMPLAQELIGAPIPRCGWVVGIALKANARLLAAAERVNHECLIQRGIKRAAEIGEADRKAAAAIDEGHDGIFT